MKDCRLDIPYPEAVTEGKNLRWAQLLSSDYAGQMGELTAITKYLYQNLILEERCPELASTLRCVAMVEMHHLELLGKLIVAFGGDPTYRVGSRWWNGVYAASPTDPAFILRQNLNAERMAVMGYRRRLEQIGDPCARKVIERIILDEEHHAKLFEEMLKGDAYGKTGAGR